MLASSCLVNFQGVLGLHFPSYYKSAGITNSRYCLQLYLSFGDLNIGLLHTSIENALPTELPSLQPMTLTEWNFLSDNVVFSLHQPVLPCCNLKETDM